MNSSIRNYSPHTLKTAVFISRFLVFDLIERILSIIAECFWNVTTMKCVFPSTLSELMRFFFIWSSHSEWTWLKIKALDWIEWIKRKEDVFSNHRLVLLPIDENFDHPHAILSSHIPNFHSDHKEHCHYYTNPNCNIGWFATIQHRIYVSNHCNSQHWHFHVTLSWQYIDNMLDPIQ